MSLVLLLLVFLFGFLAFDTEDGLSQQPTVPLPAQKDARVARGAGIFSESGCLNCHTYAGRGSANLGAPDLTAEGKKGRGVKFQIAHLRCPSCLSSGSPMPSFKALGNRNLRLLAVFLEASKGPA